VNQTAAEPAPVAEPCLRIDGMLAVVVLPALADENSRTRVRNVVATARPKSTRSERRQISSRLTSHLYARTKLRLALRRPRPILTDRLGVDS